jgi:phosphate-selective porin OprO/OprP
MILPVVLAGVLLFQIGSACGEKVYFAGYNGGFYIRSEEEGGMDLRLGGALQADYRYFTEDERAANGFDVRRARLVFRGTLTRWVRFGMEFEFQGNETDNLVDAYVEAVRDNHALRFGQFRQPFSLEWQTRDKAQYFSERSMAWSLSPKRDVGLMLHGSMNHDAVCYALGLFNGDGDDGASRGNEEDTPELSGRLVISPFRHTGSVLDGFQMGASFSWARIETLNVSLKVKSSGMATSALSVYELTHNTKFGVLQDVDARLRAGAEMAWAWGPLALMGEYVRLSYTDLEPVGSAPEDADFSAWYAAALWNITGEPVVFRKGVLQPLYPKRFFNPDENSWGAFCLGVRVEHFNGDKDWINPASHVSSETADTCSLALSWVLFPMYRVIVDLSHTRLSDPVRARVRPDGGIDYVDTEQCLTARFSIDF